MTRHDERRMVLRLALFAGLMVAMYAPPGVAETDETPVKEQKLHHWTENIVWVYVYPRHDKYIGRAPDGTSKAERWEVTQLPQTDSRLTLKYFIDNRDPGKDAIAYYQFDWHDQQGGEVLITVASRYVISDEESRQTDNARNVWRRKPPLQRPRNGRMYGLEN